MDINVNRFSISFLWKNVSQEEHSGKNNILHIYKFIKKHKISTNNSFQNNTLDIYISIFKKDTFIEKNYNHKFSCK